MNLFISVCTILLVLYDVFEAVRFKPTEKGWSEKYDKGYLTKGREKRSLVKLATKIVSQLTKTKNTRFLYSNGWHKVFAKRGGRKEALQDFDSLDPTNVKQIGNRSKGPVQTTGRVGDVDISVDINPSRGSVVLTIKKPTVSVQSTSGATDPKSVDTIIVYTNR